ncbi:hypothetical protein U9M48_004191 [Paspalum notatum var. saurae]|uniref:Uncharacterized protein n=1 Tax=Paspalum notatum var. saurae TaxID=547442 RepID=A0AAQ3PSS5_PASNO
MPAVKTLLLVVVCARSRLGRAPRRRAGHVAGGGRCARMRTGGEHAARRGIHTAMARWSTARRVLRRRLSYPVAGGGEVPARREDRRVLSRRWKKVEGTDLVWGQEGPQHPLPPPHQWSTLRALLDFFSPWEEEPYAEAQLLEVEEELNRQLGPKLVPWCSLLREEYEYALFGPITAQAQGGPQNTKSLNREMLSIFPVQN